MTTSVHTPTSPATSATPATSASAATSAAGAAVSPTDGTPAAASSAAAATTGPATASGIHPSWLTPMPGIRSRRAAVVDDGRDYESAPLLDGPHADQMADAAADRWERHYWG